MSWQYDFFYNLGGKLGVKMMEKSMVELCKEMIDLGCDINETLGDNMPLWATLLYDSEVPLSMINLLFENGATIPKEGEDSPSLLLAAAKNGVDEKIIELLIEYGSDASYVDEDNETVLQYACFNHYYSVELFKLLVESGSPINLQNSSYGESPLINACLAGLDVEVIRYLIEAGADVNATNIDGDTPLICLCIKNFDVLDSVKILVESGAKLDIFTDGGLSVVGIVADSYLAEGSVMEYFIEQGADPNRVEVDRTYLMMSAGQGNWEVTETLIKGGFSNFNYKDEDGNTVFSQLDEEDLAKLKKLISKYSK